MARTAAEAAKILIEIFDESFGTDFYEKYRIQWQQAREICAVKRLDAAYLNEICGELNNLGYSLASFNDFILVLNESDVSEARSVPARLVEKYLFEDVKEESAAAELEDFESED